MTESGIEKVERALKVENLYDPANVQLVNHLHQALKAEALWKRDVDYVIADGEVKIVDEFTGPASWKAGGWSERDLHEAVEAKEGVEIMEEKPDGRDDHPPGTTSACTTSSPGMTVYRQAPRSSEFVEIYGLEVGTRIPTQRRRHARDDSNAI